MVDIQKHSDKQNEEMESGKLRISSFPPSFLPQTASAT